MKSADVALEGGDCSVSVRDRMKAAKHKLFVGRIRGRCLDQVNGQCCIRYLVYKDNFGSFFSSVRPIFIIFSSSDV